MRYRLACLLLLCPLAATAQTSPPASVAECERIKNDLAYNQCLASFGPKRGERTRGVAVEDDDGPAVRPARRGGRATRRGGRQAAAFDVVTGRSAPARRSRR
jgi:hypothetical protein